jgi:hypothetical protein
VIIVLSIGEESNLGVKSGKTVRMEKKFVQWFFLEF